MPRMKPRNVRRLTIYGTACWGPLEERCGGSPPVWTPTRRRSGSYEAHGAHLSQIREPRPMIRESSGIPRSCRTVATRSRMGPIYPVSQELKRGRARRRREARPLHSVVAPRHWPCACD